MWRQGGTVLSHDHVRFAVLGPVRAWRDGNDIDLGAPQQRTLLALLLVHGGQPVSLSAIVEAMWGEDPPHSAVNTVHRSVGLLRRALQPELASRDPGRWLIRAAGGYQLVVDASSLDLLRFRELIHQGRTAIGGGEPASAVEPFARALELWRGPTASGIDAESRSHPAFAAVDREYLATAREAADLALSTGIRTRLLPAMYQAAERGPLDEALHARLIRILGAESRQVEALDIYQQVRRRLSDDLGIDPGAELRSARDAVLAPPGPDPGVSETPRPAQLPADLSTFSGRRAELAAALALHSGTRDLSQTVVITAIGGMAGIGKTSLAVHWAHQVADRFPDGQLYVNLRGFDPKDDLVPPGQALEGFLSSLGVPAAQIPAALDTQAALYRSRIAGQRMLILLDNARDADQVRPLLPGHPGCLVIVTSRNQLTGLVATHGAHTLTLDLLPAADAHDFLARRLGVTRVAADPAAVDEIITLCAGLPLALAIVAARAADHPTFTLPALAAEIRESHGSLHAFAGPEPAINARAVFSWSYRSLTPAGARLFRLLSLATGPDISVAAATSLNGEPRQPTRACLTELTRAHLLTERAPGRYTLPRPVARVCRRTRRDRPDRRAG